MSHAVALRHFVAEARPCAWGKADPSGPLLSSTPCGFRCDSPWPGELAFDAAKSLEVVEGHLVETIERAQSIDAVLGVAGVVNKVKRFVPWAALAANMMP
jgi:hypothetical protein